MKILVLDDSIDNINLIKLYVKKSSDEFSFFIDSSEALEVMKRERFDLIFLDLQMPILDGFEVLDMIRKDDENKESFVCALSAFSLDKEIDKIFLTPYIVETDF